MHSVQLVIYLQYMRFLESRGAKLVTALLDAALLASTLIAWILGAALVGMGAFTVAHAVALAGMSAAAALSIRNYWCVHQHH